MVRQSYYFINLVLLMVLATPAFSEKPKEYFFYDGEKCLDKGPDRNFPKCEALDPLSIYSITPKQIALYRARIEMGCDEPDADTDPDKHCSVLEHIGASTGVRYQIKAEAVPDIVDSGYEQLETGERTRDSETDQAKWWYTLKIMGMGELCLTLAKRNMVDEEDCVAIVIQEKMKLLPED